MALPCGLGGVTTQVDERGRTQSLSQPGLATKSFAYDDSDELTQVSIGERVVESYTYDAGRLSQYSAGEGAEAETVAIQYDGQDRVKTLTSSTGGPLAEYSYGDTAEKTGKTAVKFANKIRTYRDPNGVLATYSYADNGSIKSIDIENGPSFRYSYDADNDLESVHLDDMKAEFGSYTHYRPSTVKWLYNGAPVETLTSQFDQQGRLTSLGNGAYQLELTWSTVAKAPDAGEDQGEIIRVVRKAPGFAEIWIPSYDAETRLQSVEIQRFADGDPTGTPSQIIEEGYGPVVHRIIGSLTRNVDSQALLNLSQDLDQAANGLRWSTQTDAASSNVLTASYDDTGNLAQISDSTNGVEEFHWDGFRRLSGVTKADGQSFTYKYDAQDRRILSTDSNSLDPLVYFYQDSRVIAIGQKKPWGIAWTHAIGYGPTGPVLIKDMTSDHQGRDYFVFTDQLGTPFAYRDAESGEVFFTPYSPWGELLANPAGVPQAVGTVETVGFDLPPDPLFATTPLSLGGHLLDHKTGLIYMHHRYYSPRQGQFLTPDFRAPDIYDPTTTSEPYAYANGNPMMFWDPDGLEWFLFEESSTGKHYLYWVGDNNPEAYDRIEEFRKQGNISELGSKHSDLIESIGLDPSVFETSLYIHPEKSEMMTVDVIFTLPEQLCPDCTKEELTFVYSSTREMTNVPGYMALLDADPFFFLDSAGVMAFKFIKGAGKAGVQGAKHASRQATRMLSKEVMTEIFQATNASTQAALFRSLNSANMDFGASIIIQSVSGARSILINESTLESVSKSVFRHGRLPKTYITKNMAKGLGYKPKLGNFAAVAPGKVIGGDIFKNIDGLLPSAPGRVWYEADINYLGGKSRGLERLVYSNDGLIYYTGDHYASFTLLGAR